MNAFCASVTSDNDQDPAETHEWVDALRAVTQTSGRARTHFLLRSLRIPRARSGVFTSGQPFSAYRNTIPLEHQGAYPGDLAIAERLTSIIRWNALAMVAREQDLRQAGRPCRQLRQRCRNLRDRLQLLLPRRPLRVR